jgi:hypothetical protein
MIYVRMMNWKGFGREQLWPIEDTVIVLPRGADTNHKKQQSG